MMTSSPRPLVTTAAAADLPATSEETSKTVFVAMTVRHRATIVYGFGAYCAAVILFGVHPMQPDSWYLVAALSIWVGLLALPLIMYEAEYGWLHPIIIPSLLSILTLARTFPAYTWGLTRHAALPYASPSELNALLAYKTLLMALAQASTLIGFWLSRGLKVPRIQTRGANGIQTRTLLVVLMSTVVAYFYIQSRGGLERFLITLGKGRHDALGGEHYLLLPAQLGLTACMLCLACRPKLFRSAFFWSLTILSLSVEAVLTFNRSGIVIGVFSLLAVRALSTNRIPFGRGTVAAIGAVYLVIVLGDIRGSTTRGKLDTTGTSKEEVGMTMSRGWSETFVARATSYDAALPILARVPNDVDLLYGESYLAVLAMPIPRGYWRDKPTLTGGRVARVFYGGLKAGIPAGSVGEAYWNFHIPGVILVHLLGGCFARLVARLRERNVSDPLATVLFVTFLVYLIPTSEFIVIGLLRVVQYVTCALFLLRLGGDPLPTDFAQLGKARGVRVTR